MIPQPWNVALCRVRYESALEDSDDPMHRFGTRAWALLWVLSRSAYGSSVEYELMHNAAAVWSEMTGEPLTYNPRRPNQVVKDHFSSAMRHLTGAGLVEDGSGSLRQITQAGWAATGEPGAPPRPQQEAMF